MLKMEKKVLAWVEKNMFLLMVLISSAIGLYLRKTAVWWNSPDLGYYFDSHENHVQSTFYYLLVQMVQHLPLLPLHSVKWLAGLADYVVAGLCLVILGSRFRRIGLKTAFCVTTCILSPVVFLRGICWAQVDSIAFAFLLGALILWERNKKAWAAVLAVPGLALYPCFLVLAFGWLLYRKAQGKDWVYGGATAVGCVLLQMLAALALGQTWLDSLLSCIRWSTYDPYQGTVYQDSLLWVKQMVNLFGYGVAMTGMIAAFRHKVSWGVVLLIHLAVLLVYGNLLFPVGG